MPEEILVFKIGAIAPAEHLQGEHVLSRLHVSGDIELRLQPAVFAVTHEFSVDPQIHVGCHGAEMGDDLFPVPVCRYVDSLSVRSYVVLLFRNVRRIVAVVPSPRVADVQVDRISVSVQLPDAWHRHLPPVCVIESGLPESGRPLPAVPYPFEFPLSVESHIVL